MISPRVPFTVIGGFLGAGKTTLLNHWLRHAEGKRIAVLVNDFGALNIDAALIESNRGDVIALTNGCVCCQIGDDLSLALMRLLDSGVPFDAVVVEASGVSDPWRIAQLGRADPRLQLDAVVVLVDAGAALHQARDPLLADTLQRQLAMADLVVVNKTDLAAADELTALHEWLRVQGCSAQAIEAVNAAVPSALLSSAMLPDRAHNDVVHHSRSLPESGDANRALPEHVRYLAEFRPLTVDHGAQFETWSCQPARAFTEAELRDWLRAPPAGVLRLKGWLRGVGPDAQPGGWELQFAGRQGTLRRAPGEVEGAALVAIGLHGGLPIEALRTAFAGRNEHAGD